MKTNPKSLAVIRHSRTLIPLLYALSLVLAALAPAMADTTGPIFAGLGFTHDGITYAWDSATEDLDANGHLLLHTDKYLDGTAAHQMLVWGDAIGNGGISDGGSGILGAVFAGALYFDRAIDDPTNASGPYGRSRHILFGATYQINRLTYSLGRDNAGAPMLGATESYAADNGGSLSIFHRDVNNLPDGYGGTFSGHDPTLGDFGGTYADPGTLSFTIERTAPSFAPSNLWVNSTLVIWQPSTILNSAGDVADAYIGEDMDHNMVTLTVSGNVPAFRSGGGDDPSVLVEVRDAGGVLLSSGAGTYVRASPNYFSMEGWYVGTAQYSRMTPFWLPSNPSLWVNGTRYAFRGGIDDGAGKCVDTYANESVGRLVFSGTPSSTLDPGANVRVGYHGTNYGGTYNVDGNGNFLFPMEGMAVEMTGADVPAIWVQGSLYLRSSINVASYANAAGQVINAVPAGGNIQISGADEVSDFSGSFTEGSGGIFHCTRSTGEWLSACLANANGSLRLHTVNPPSEMPPAIAVYGDIWPFLGSDGDPADPAAQVAWYGHAGAGARSTFLTIAGDGTAVLTDCTAQSSVSGTYSLQTHLFQTTAGQLPMPLYGTAPTDNNVRWGWQQPGAGRPATVLVDGNVWGFTGTDEAGGSHYAGYYTGQEMTIAAPGRSGAGTVALSSWPGTSYSGIYYKGGFLMDGGSPAVTSGNGQGAATGPSDGIGRYQSIVADLDVSGNLLTLGSWASDLNHAGMALQYSEPATDGKARIYLTGSRQDTSYIWNHATISGATTFATMMLLSGADHALKLYGPLDNANAAITLNPSGQSYWLNFGPFPDTANDPGTGVNKTKGILVVGAGTKVGATVTRRNAMRITDDGVVLIQESGDIPMGEFSAGPRP